MQDKNELAERVHQVYSSLLEELSLEKAHYENLSARGFSDEEILTNNYKSLPLRRKELAAKLASKFNNDLSGVPGFWRNQRGEWELAGKAGIVIPVRALDSRIVALKLRVDKPSNPSHKYVLLSSNPKADAKTGEIRFPQGTSAPTVIHHPLGSDCELTELRFTEGELKADIAASILPQHTVSLPGVSMWRMAVELARELKPAKVLLAFDSDKNKAVSAEGSGDSSYGNFQRFADPQNGGDDFAVGKALASLYLSLKEAGFNVVIEDWPESAGKGIDDVLMAGDTDKIIELSAEEAEAFAKGMLSAGLPDDWVYVVGVKRFYHLHKAIELDKEQFNDQYCHEGKGQPALKALTNPAFPKVDLPIYMPTKETIYVEDGKKYLNTWRRNPLQPSPGDVAPFLEHCEYMVPAPDERKVFLDWLAYNVQNPGKKILWAVILQGIQGTGKSYFGKLMRSLLGPGNVSSPTNDVIHEVYTAWQKSCQLVIIEELMARGRMELMNKLKPVITQDITIVREMHKPCYEQPNVFNLLTFTNHEDAVILDKTDRRYCVIFSPAEPRKVEYYQKLWDWTEANLSALLHFMATRALENFQPKGHAPMTAGKREIILNSASALQQWLADCLDSEQWPLTADLVSPSHLITCFPKGMQSISIKGVVKILKDLGCQDLGQVRLKAGPRVRLWSVRRHEVWASAEHATLAQEYERFSMASQPGGNPMMDARPM